MGQVVLKDGRPPIWPIELKCGAIWDISRNSLGEPLKKLDGNKKKHPTPSQKEISFEPLGLHVASPHQLNIVFY